MWFTGAANGWIVGDGAAMLHTTNGGTTWTATVADVSGPRTFAPSPVTVKQGAVALLPCRVTDTQSATATVTVRSGRTGESSRCSRSAGARPGCGSTPTSSAACRGAPTASSVYATDEAGNSQTRLGWNTLTVK